MNLGCCWIVDVDLRKFFDTIDHGHLREFLKRRVRDGVIVRLIGKWLNAGVMEEGVHTTPEDGAHKAGFSAPTFESVLALRAGPVVRQGGSPSPEGGSVSDSLCGRLRDRGGPRRRRTANHGRLTQADEQVRLDGSPGENAAHPVPPGGYARLRQDGRRILLAQDIRLPGLHPLLGRVTRRRMGDQAQDGQEPAQASTSRAVGLVSEESTPAGHGSTPNAEAEAARPLRVLRNHGQLLQPPGVPGGGAEDRKRWLSRRRRGGFMSWTDFLRLEQGYVFPRARVVHSLLGRAAT